MVEVENPRATSVLVAIRGVLGAVAATGTVVLSREAIWGGSAAVLGCFTGASLNQPRKEN